MSPVTGKEATPLPFWQMVIVVAIQLAEAINVNILFPFLAFMIEDLGYTGARLGYYAGGLAAAFCGAQFSSSVLWGMFSDRFGRKPAIILGTFGTAFGMLIFGTAKTYSQAIIGRVIGGFLCGNLGVMKSFLAEITDDTNRGKGFSYTSAAWAVGTLVAPLTSGLLCNPADKYPSLFSQDGVFGEYPYLLPCLLSVAFNVFTSILCAIFMIETRFTPKPPVPSSSETEASSSSGSTKGIEMTSIFGKKTTKQAHKGDYAPLSEDSTSFDPEMANNSGRSSVFVISNDEDDDDEEEEEGDRTTDEGEEEQSPAFNRDHMHSHTFKHKPLAITDLTDNESSLSSFSQNSNEDADEEGDDSDEESERCDCCTAAWYCGGGWNHTSKTPIESSEHDDMNTMATSSHGLMTTDLEDPSANTKSLHNNPKQSVLLRRTVLLATNSYGLLAMAYILFDETIPLFLKLDKAQGGFDFGSAQIGLLLSISGGVMILFTSFVLPKIANRSTIWMYETGIMYGAPLALGWPILAIINAQILLHINNPVTYVLILWPSLLLVCVAKNICACLSFTAVMIQVTHSVESEYLGAVNGLGQSLASLARAVGPAIGGILWSISIQTQFVFLNFLAVIVLLLVCAIINRQMPAWIDKKKQTKAEKRLARREALMGGESMSSKERRENIEAINIMH